MIKITMCYSLRKKILIIYKDIKDAYLVGFSSLNYFSVKINICILQYCPQFTS